jgi:hypothetical protein
MIWTRQGGERMFARYQQLSSPLLLPMLGSILTVSVISTIFLLPPSSATLSFPQLFLEAAFDLLIAASVHTITAWSLWRLIREYIEPSGGTLVVHIWAAVVWLPLITTLNAEHSVWISGFVPWAFANAVAFLNLWSKLPQEKESVAHVARSLFQPPAATPLWRALLPYCIMVVIVQGGLISLAARHRWVGTALICAGVLLFLVHHPLVHDIAKSRRKFSRFSLLQTALVFFLISTALTPYLQKAYGLRFLASLLVAPAPHATATLKGRMGTHYSAVILTLPPKPHPRIQPLAVSEPTNYATALSKPVIIPFDGAYWYFKKPELRPSFDALVQQGDPMKAGVRSTDHHELTMEAHQALPTPLSGNCCHAIRVNLLNGDDRPGLIQIAVFFRNTSAKPGYLVSLGTIPVPSSQLEHTPNRQAVRESLRFPLPATARDKSFNEITVVIKPSAERAFAGSKIAIQNFELVP